MPKRIYVGKLKDAATLAAVARKTGIAADRLARAARGEIELSAAELERVSRALNVSEAGQRGD